MIYWTVRRGSELKRPAISEKSGIGLADSIFRDSNCSNRQRRLSKDLALEELLLSMEAVVDVNIFFVVANSFLTFLVVMVAT